MGIVNLTPNSFWDGGQYNHPEKLKKRLEELSFASIIDIGAESTAPHNSPISGCEEYERFKQFKLHERSWDQMVSIDTYRLQTFRMLQDRFTIPLIFNDVSGKLENDLAKLLHKTPRSAYIFCHNLCPRREESSHHMHYTYRGEGPQLLSHLYFYFKRAIRFWQDNHLKNPLLFDIAFGFSKNYQQNCFLLKNLEKLFANFSKEQYWVIGFSRKSFLQKKAQKRGVSYEKLEQNILLDCIKRLQNHRVIYRLHHGKIFS